MCGSVVVVISLHGIVIACFLALPIAGSCLPGTHTYGSFYSLPSPFLCYLLTHTAKRREGLLELRDDEAVAMMEAGTEHGWRGSRVLRVPRGALARL